MQRLLHYHSYTDYAERTSQGYGIQDLKRIGDRVVVEITSTTMWGIPVDRSIPVTKLTIRAVGEEEFGRG